MSTEPQPPTFTDRRVLVTGAGGFLGRWLCRALLERGAEVHGTVLNVAAPPGVTAHQVDLRGGSAVTACFERVRPAFVFHLAAPVNLSRDPQAFVTLRAGILDATHHVAAECLRRDARLISAGTCEEYGDIPAPFHEDDRPRPVSAYSCLKLAATQWLLTLHRLSGLRVTVVRPFLTYGPGQAPERLIPAAVGAALAGHPFPITDGRQTREFNHVRDVVQRIAAAAAPQTEGDLLNIGGGSEHSVRDLATAIFRLAGADPDLVQIGALPRRGGEVARFYGDHARADRLLGPIQRTPLEQGLRETIEHERDHDDQ